MSIRTCVDLALMAAAALCIGTTARPAQASTLCNVQSVRLSKTSSTGNAELAISCDGVWYLADVSNSIQNCNRGWDAIKAWAAIAQAGQLSGRKVSFDYTTVSGCSSLGTNIINNAQLEGN